MCTKKATPVCSNMIFPKHRVECRVYKVDTDFNYLELTSSLLSNFKTVPYYQNKGDNRAYMIDLYNVGLF